MSTHRIDFLETRASAQRVPNTPGQRHFLIIKYFKVNDNDIRQDTDPKYNFPEVNK